MLTRSGMVGASVSVIPVVPGVPGSAYKGQMGTASKSATGRIGGSLTVYGMGGLSLQHRTGNNGNRRERLPDERLDRVAMKLDDAPGASADPDVLGIAALVALTEVFLRKIAP